MIERLKNDSDFQSLIKKYEKPNCFEVMGNTRREEWHSNFWCWLLNPKANHDLGSVPMELLVGLMAQKYSKKYSQIDVTKLKELDFTPELVIPDGRLDIFAENAEVVFVIENKVEAAETFNTRKKSNQTDTYYKYFESCTKYTGKQKYYIFLSKSNDVGAPANENFDRLCYQELYDHVLRPCLDMDSVAPETRMILENYANVLTGLGLPAHFKNRAGVHLAYVDGTVAEKIYQKHADTFEAIRTVMNDLERDADSEICVFYRDYVRYINEVLGACKQHLISPRRDARPTDQEQLKFLVEDGIVTPGVTELYGTRKSPLKNWKWERTHSIEYIIRIVDVGGEYKCVASCIFTNKRTGEITDECQVVDENEQVLYFNSISGAATSAEVEAYRYLCSSYVQQEGAGIASGQFRIRKAKNVEYEDKLVDDVYQK